MSVQMSIPVKGGGTHENHDNEDHDAPAANGNGSCHEGQNGDYDAPDAEPQRPRDNPSRQAHVRTQGAHM